jgi:hypothetical protein
MSMTAQVVFSGGALPSTPVIRSAQMAARPSSQLRNWTQESGFAFVRPSGRLIAAKQSVSAMTHRCPPPRTGRSRGASSHHLGRTWGLAPREFR